MRGPIWTLLLGTVLLAFTSGAALALDPAPAAAVKVTPLASASQTAAGQPITLPQKNVQVMLSTYEIPAGATLPVHQHPFARYALVQAGVLEVTNVQTGKATTYKAGDFIVEMIATWHRAANHGSEPVKLLVLDQIEAGGMATLLQK